MSENDAKRFIAENTRDRRPSLVDISDKLGAAVFGSPSRKPVAKVSNVDDEGTCQTCDGAGDGPDGTCWNCNGSGITKY
jgi:hypothetical protein